MPRRTWTVQLENGAHTVELTHGYLTGKRVIKVDGVVVHSSTKLMDFGGSYPLMVAEHHGFVLIRLNFVTYYYDLVLDGVSVEKGKPFVPPLPLPIWGWMFIVACLIMPVLTRLAAIPVIIGAGSAMLCVHVLQNASWSRAMRIGGALGVVAACWLLFGMFFSARLLPSNNLCPLVAPFPTPTLERNWVVRENRAERFTIALPESWQVIEYGPDGDQTQLEQLEVHDPRAAVRLDGELRNTTGQGAVFLAADVSMPESEVGLPGTVSVYKKQLPQGLRLRDYVESNFRALSRQDQVQEPISCELRGNGDGSLGVLRFRSEFTQNNGSVVLKYNSVYVATRGQYAYLVVLVIDPAYREKYALLFETVGPSFRLSE